MRYVLKPLLVTVMLLSLAGVASAKEWRGIVPLQSTRQDVTRLLGNPYDANSIRANYFLEKEDVYFVFSSEESKQECVRKLPPATVLLIGVRPKGDVSLIEFHFDDSRFRKFDPGSGFYPGMEGYISDEDGLVLRVEHGKVREICYIATSKDRQLCPEYYEGAEEMVRVGAPHPIKFDEWGDIRFRDEKARLDNAFISLRQQPGNIMYLIINAGERACVGEAKARGIRAKNYLVRHRGAKPDRIVWIDGGYQVSPRTTIWIWPANLGQPPIIPDLGLDPTQMKLDPTKMKFEKNCRIKYRGGTR
jgi:hypothetical protein